MTLDECLAVIATDKARRKEKLLAGKRSAYRRYAARNKESRHAYGKAYRDANKEKVREGQYRARRANPEKYREIKARWRAANKHKTRDSRLRQQYGLSQDDWNVMFAAQGHCCKICKGTTTNSTGWHTDHDHLTNLIRGILCSSCNWMLGAAKDSVATLAAAIEYLRCT